MVPLEGLLMPLLLMAVVLGGWFALRLATRGDVRGPQARELVAAGARLVDVRSPAEFASGHLPGAVNVPVDALERRLGDVGPKDRPVVVYCASGARSAHAKRVLLASGWSDVRNLGAMSAW
jgi:phage shock protein E